MLKEKLIEQINLNKTIFKIAEYFNKSPSTIKYWIKKYNLSEERKNKKDSKVCPSYKDKDF